MVSFPRATVSITFTSVPGSFLLTTESFDFSCHPGEITSGCNFLLWDVHFHGRDQSVFEDIPVGIN